MDVLRCLDTIPREGGEEEDIMTSPIVSEQCVSTFKTRLYLCDLEL